MHDDPSRAFASTLEELAAIRRDLESGRIDVDELPQTLERAARLLDRGRDVLYRGDAAVEVLEGRIEEQPE
jgi:exonuclease VII small subunit